MVTLGGVSVPGARRGGRWGCLTPGLPPPTPARLVHVPPLGKPLLSLFLRRGGAPGTPWKPRLSGKVLPAGHWLCPVTHWMYHKQHFASFANPGKQGLHPKAMVGLRGDGVQHLGATLSKSVPSLPCPHLSPRVGWQSPAPCLGWQPRGAPPQSQPQLLGRGQEGDTQEPRGAWRSCWHPLGEPVSPCCCPGISDVSPGERGPGYSPLAPQIHAWPCPVLQWVLAGDGGQEQS